MSCLFFSSKALQRQLIQILQCNLKLRTSNAYSAVLAYQASSPAHLQSIGPIGGTIKIESALYKARCPCGINPIPQQCIPSTLTLQNLQTILNNFTKSIPQHEAVCCPVCTGRLRNGRGRSKSGSESWVLPEGTILQRRHLPVLPGTRELQWKCGKSIAPHFPTDMVKHDSRQLRKNLVQVNHRLQREFRLPQGYGSHLECQGCPSLWSLLGTPASVLPLLNGL